mgnify:CR=1 FL=1
MTVEKVIVENEQEAEALALLVLEFILDDQVLLDRFLAMSGVTPSQMKSSLTDRNFLIGVLDFLLGNEADVISFCEQREAPLENPKIAREILAGYLQG